MSPVKSRAAWRCSRIGAALLLMSAGAIVRAEAPKFDGRGWTVGHQQQNGKQSLIEYVLPGQTVENWKELVTSSLFFQPVPVAPFVEKLRASLAQGCPSLVWNMIRQDEKTAIYEWRDSGCGGFEPTSELARVTIERGGLYRLAYSVKGPLTAERRKQWLAILGQTPIAEEGAREQADEAKTAEQDPAQAARVAKVAEVLANFVRQNGHTCANPAKAGLQETTPGPQGVLSEWRLQCAGGDRYTIWAQPNGSLTVYQHPK